MEKKQIYESAVSYYKDFENTLHIFVNNELIAQLCECEGNDEYINNLIDEVVFDLGYTYIK